MISKIYNIKDIVYHLMLNYPEMRDNDRQLMLNVWDRQDGELVTKSFKEFAGDFKKGKYADPESIRRTRQKLQELHPALRGRTYSQRQGEMLQMKEIMPKLNI